VNAREKNILITFRGLFIPGSKKYSRIMGSPKPIFKFKNKMGSARHAEIGITWQVLLVLAPKRISCGNTDREAMGFEIAPIGMRCFLPYFMREIS
jgi:hypothetical protein